jgi:hypothetical protein
LDEQDLDKIPKFEDNQDDGENTKTADTKRGVRQSFGDLSLELAKLHVSYNLIYFCQ